MPTAVQAQQPGGPEQMQAVQLPERQPGDGELLVDVGAAGVNFIDTYIRSGLYPRPRPLELGLEGAGTVAAVGPGVTGFALGSRVAWAHAPGSYAEQAVVPAAAALPVPDGVPDDTAAALPLQGLTAHYLAASTYPVAEGDTVLVHAAAGGVGLLLTQLATARGARVIATASTDAKRDLARGAGAAEVIGYEGFAQSVRELTDGAGVAAVYDGVGRDTFEGSLESLRPRGTLVLFGASSGPVDPVDPQRLNTAGSVYLTRPSLAAYTSDPAELRWRAEELFCAAADGRLSVRIGASYPLADAARAHADLQARRTTGKLILTT